jgi:hypothetical protein
MRFPKSTLIALVAALVGSSTFVPAFSAAPSSDRLHGWTPWRISESCRLKVENEGGCKGGPAVRLTAVGGWKDQFGFFQEFLAGNFIGKRVELSAFLKTANVNEHSGLMMVVLDADEKPLFFDNMGNRSVRGTRTWRRYSSVLDVPKNANSILIGVAQRGSGTTWVSNPGFAVISASPQKKTTQMPIDDTKYPVAGRAGEKAELSFRNRKSEEDTGSFRLSNWSINSSNQYEVSADEVILFEGQNSGHIEAKNDSPKGFATLYQTLRAEPFRGKKLEFSGYVKTKDISDWTGLWLRIDGDGSVLAFDNMEQRPIKGTQDWKKESVVLSVPQNAHRLKFGFMQAGSGSSWIGKCQLQTVGLEFPDTAKPMKPIPIPRPEVREKPHLELESR